jgi:glyoxylate/hydroxypyruvate reductase A
VAAATGTTVDGPARLDVLIATPLEPEHVATIEAADPRLQVHYAPELLPVPRYVADHDGVPRDLDEGQVERWRSMLAQAQVTFGLDWWAPHDMPVNCPRLAWVQGTSAGMGGQLDRVGLLGSRLVVTTAAGVHGVPMAEFALTGALHFAKGVPQLLRQQAARRWERHTTGELAGATALVVGLGGIGREVARLFAALDVEVCGAGRPGRAYAVPGVTRYVPFTELDSVLPSVDVLVLCAPLTPETTGLIGERQLRLLPRGAVLVNIGRGPIVDEEALIEALRDGHLGGAALDVVTTEPLPPESPLWALGNVLISPHSAATVPAENARITEIFTDNLRRWLAGEPLRNVFDHDRGY